MEIATLMFVLFSMIFTVTNNALIQEVNEKSEVQTHYSEALRECAGAWQTCEEVRRELRYRFQEDSESAPG